MRLLAAGGLSCCRKVDAGFRRRSCSNNQLGRDGDSKDQVITLRRDGSRFEKGDRMVRVGWCNDRGEVDRLAQFFARNVTQFYISHSELQFGRAVAPDRWIDDLVAKFRAEIAERVPCAPGAALRVASADDGGE